LEHLLVGARDTKLWSVASVERQMEYAVVVGDMEIRNNLQLLSRCRRRITRLRIQLQDLVDDFLELIRSHVELLFDFVVMFFGELIQVIFYHLDSFLYDFVVLVFFTQLDKETLLKVACADTCRFKTLDNMKHIQYFTLFGHDVLREGQVVDK